MGSLHVGPSQIYRFEDRLLAHLRSVIIGKLLQQESFLFTWDDASIQRSVWIHPASPLEFEFDNTERIPLNRTWVNALMSLANGPSGLHLVEEPPGEH
ncbi:MAG: DUF7882 family protein [Leucobacter sp.]